MALGCDLEVDVNGEEIFFVDKKILQSFSHKLSKLFSTSSLSATTKTPKVIFHDLPGGPEAFELMTRFCYNNGRTQITPTNACLLHCAAHFMEMAELIKLAEKSMEGIPYWSWSEILIALKQCENYFPLANSSGIFEKVLDSLVVRITTASDASPPVSSAESAGIRFSCDTRSTASTKNSFHRTWWFDDLAAFNSETIENVIKCLISREIDHATISRFLFYYLKCKFSNAPSDEKRKATEKAVDLLCSLDTSCLSCKSLFGILSVSSPLNLSQCCRSRLEGLIGSQIDQATLDNLLVPSPSATESLYDVSLVLRFLKSFINGGDRTTVTRLKRVGSLLDLYIAEVAPDSCLKPSKFIALATALPDGARDSHDAIYRAIDMYLDVHTRLSEEEKMKICCAINYEKLSSESCRHLAQNSKFPSRTAVRALISQHLKLQSLLQDATRNGKKSEDGDQIVLYAKKLDLSEENEKLKDHLQRMQWRVMELEKICRKMQTQVAKVMKAKISSPSGSRSLPRLCS